MRPRAASKNVSNLMNLKSLITIKTRTGQCRNSTELSQQTLRLRISKERELYEVSATELRTFTETVSKDSFRWGDAILKS